MSPHGELGTLHHPAHHLHHHPAHHLHHHPAHYLHHLHQHHLHSHLHLQEDRDKVAFLAMILFRISFGKNEAVVEVGTEWRLVERLLAAALGRVETGCPASLMVVACPPGGRWPTPTGLGAATPPPGRRLLEMRPGPKPLADDRRGTKLE